MTSLVVWLLVAVGAISQLEADATRPPKRNEKT